MFLLHLNDMLFLAIYGTAFVLTVGLAALLRWYLRLPGDEPAGESLYLDPYAIAYLTGGERLAVNGAITSLVQRDLLSVRAIDHRLSPGRDPLPHDAHLLERIIHDTVASQPEQSLREVRRRTAEAIGLVSVQLQELGLLVAGRRAHLARLLPLALVLSLAVVAAVPLLASLVTGQSVGLPAVASAVTVLVALTGFGRRPHRSRRGDRVLARFKEENEPLHYTAQRRPDSLAGIDLALVVGLYGTDVLEGGPLANLHTALTPPTRTGSRV